MINVYDNVNATAKDLAQTEQYLALKDALAAVHADTEAEAVFKRFQSEQQAIQAAVQAGQEPTQDQIKTWQEVAADMDKSEVLQTLMQAEGAMNNLLQDINSIITKPIADLYE